MIKSITRSFLINLFALWVTAHFVTGFTLSDGLNFLLILSLAFTALHLIVKPILEMILGGVNFLTLGLVGLIIDSGILFGLSRYLPDLQILPWSFSGFTYNGFTIPSYDFNAIGTTVIAALTINLIRLALNILA